MITPEASGASLRALTKLRDKIVAYQQGTQIAKVTPAVANGPGKHRRAAERREVETIQKTLSVVLAEIDAALADAQEPTPPKIERMETIKRLTDQLFIDRKRPNAVEQLAIAI